MPGSPPRPLGSVTLTEGIRISVSPVHLPDQSKPEAHQYVFGYRIRIANESPRRVKLLTRTWLIVDADGERREVEGEGVVGEQPDLGPGESFTYASYCPLGTPWGTMEGSYHMVAENGEEFDARIDRFYLAIGAAADE